MKSALTALAEPTRLKIVELLRDGPLTVNQIAERLGLGQPQASKHLRTLHEAGLVEVQPQANRRLYSLLPQPFQELGAWADGFRQAIEERYDRLDGYLARVQGTKKKSEKEES